MVTDGITGVVQWARGAFDDQLEISLPQRAELDYRGRRITLGADDLVDPRDRARVLSRFSAQLALARRGVVELAARPAGSKLAVLELRHADMRDEDARYFADAVRTALVRARPGVDLITRENLLVLLAGTDPAACEGECEVETGRRIGADQVVSGEVLKLGETFKLSLKLHDTREGRLLNATSCSGASLEELDRALPSTVADLLR